MMKLIRNPRMPAALPPLRSRLKVGAWLMLAGLWGAHAPAGLAATNNMAGNWDSVTLSGHFGALSPRLKDFRWQFLEQTRLRDDSPEGFRFSENLLFSQLGYAINDHASVWLGYVHDWIHPLDKLAFQESRPYEDFLWISAFGDLKLTSRSRLEQRINQTTGNLGVRARQMLQLNYPLRFIHDDLGVYVGDEVLGYLNTNHFGPTGFSENRAFAGLGFQFTQRMGADLGYLGQYVVNRPGNDLFTHNVQFNLRFTF
ncbi:Protein of unknown function [Methylomagnum ishizawai]|uniref:DUF2490 domain-containing protein n=2 Tax=Methylomagnum ishizawai TaxID=1760988 RepID=A0A1Y6D3W9_9GAMM|nr:Protein of unknown function [Methylomagnum ishizawai]